MTLVYKAPSVRGVFVCAFVGFFLPQKGQRARVKLVPEGSWVICYSLATLSGYCAKRPGNAPFLSKLYVFWPSSWTAVQNGDTYENYQLRKIWWQRQNLCFAPLQLLKRFTGRWGECFFTFPASTSCKKWNKTPTWIPFCRKMCYSGLFHRGDNRLTIWLSLNFGWNYEKINMKTLIFNNVKYTPILN